MSSTASLMRNGPSRPDGTAARQRLRGLRQFGRDASGASAVEFALIALPLFYMLFVILEIGIVFFANYELENAAAQGARMLRTGQAQNQKFDAADVQDRGLQAHHRAARLREAQARCPALHEFQQRRPDPAARCKRRSESELRLRSRSRRRCGGGKSLLSFGPARSAATRYQHGQHEPTATGWSLPRSPSATSRSKSPARRNRACDAPL